MTGTGLKQLIGVEHRDGKGNLIHAEYTRNHNYTEGYDTWRGKWCNKNRYDATPEGLREGIITEESLIFAMKRGYNPEFTISQLVEILNT